MSATKDNKDTKSREAKDLEILTIAWKTSKVAPVVDPQALADAGLWKNASTASVSFGNLKRRLFGADWKPNNADGTAGPATPKKKAVTPRKSKAKTASNEQDVGEKGEGAIAVKETEGDVKGEDDGEPAKKKAKKAPKGKAKAKEALAEDNEENVAKEEQE